MKKTISYTLFSLLFLTCFMLLGNQKICAQENNEESTVWDQLGEFQVVEMGNVVLDKVVKEDKTNYRVKYNYAISDTLGSGEKHIYDGYVPILYYYGISKDNITDAIEYENIQGCIMGECFLSDELKIYKYNFTNKEFEVYDDNSIKIDTSGKYTLTEYGIYKLQTLEEGNPQGAPTYVIYDANVVDISVQQSNPVNVTSLSGLINVEIILRVKDLRDANVCYSGGIVSFAGDEIAINSSSCTLTKVLTDEVFLGEYDLTINFETSHAVIKNSELVVKYGGKEITLAVNYDYKKPILGGINYRNKNFIYGSTGVPSVDGLNIVSSDPVAIIHVSDDNEITNANYSYINEAGDPKEKSCSVVSIEENKYKVTCELDANDIVEDVEFKFVDAFSNECVVSQKLSFDEGVLREDDAIESHIVIENGVIKFDFSEYSDVRKFAVFYGDLIDADSIYQYAVIGETTIIPNFYYQGNANIVVFDDADNFEMLPIQNANFNKGYLKENYTKNSLTNAMGEINIEDDVLELYLLACGGDGECIENAVLTVEYGDKVEVLEENKLPKYLDILNKKYRDSTCASTVCNKEVVVSVNYSVAGVEQKVSRYYNYVDDFATMENALSINDVKLEYKQFDIVNDNSLKQKLYIGGLLVNVSDAQYNYTAEVSPVFVEYKDRNGNATELENLPYTSISGFDGFGHYLMECRLKLVKNLTTNEEYTSEVFTKSFFIDVELQDTIAPVVTLVGEGEIELKQYAAYKDDGYKCNDLSTCTVTVSYYLNDKDHVVEGVDTKVAGKYIIEYSAVDGDGNVSDTVTRIVMVASVNSFDTTSIIVIASIVVVFIAIVVAGIIIEVRKNRKMKEKEE